MSTIFSKIISGEIACYKIAEDDKHLAFLDVSPLCKGHALVIPKQAIDNIFDLEDKDLAELHIFAKQVAKKIKNVIKCKKIGIAVIGLEVAHAHIHLIPINSVSDMNFANPKLIITSEDLIDLANLIAN